MTLAASSLSLCVMILWMNVAPWPFRSFLAVSKQRKVSFFLQHTFPFSY